MIRNKKKGGTNGREAKLENLALNTMTKLVWFTNITEILT